MDNALYNKIQENLRDNGWGGVDDYTYAEFLAERKRRSANASSGGVSSVTAAPAVRNATKCRQFTVCQFNYNPRTGAFLADLTAITDNLERYKTFKEWAWVIHDKDIYTQDAIDEMNATLRNEAKKVHGLTDEAAIAQYVGNNVWAKLGDKKGVHLHIVVKTNTPLEIWKIAEWLGVPEHLVHIVKGKGALLDCTEYLTHEDKKQQQLGKIRYDDSEIHVSESFKDWRERLDARQIQEAKYGKGKTPVQKYIIDVAKYGKTLLQCKREMDTNDYIDNLSKLQKARHEYLKTAPLPNTRITFYVCGKGGEGKGVCCRLLARALCPDMDDMNSIMFPFGGAGVSFDSYDGQPVIIYSDMRAVDFMAVGRKETLTAALEPHPHEDVGEVNIKYGSVKLVHKFNIINGIEPYEDFIKALAGEYTDKAGRQHHAEKSNLEQFYRRVPVIIPINGDYFDILVNTGVFKGTWEYDTYMSIASMVGSFAKLQQRCGNNEPLLIDMSKPLVDPIVEVSEHLQKKLDTPDMTEEQIRAEFAALGYGTRINGDGTTDEQTQAEYNEFVQRWQQLNPDKPLSVVMPLKEWVLNGRRTHWDNRQKQWYRPEPEQPQQLSLFDDDKQ